MKTRYTYIPRIPGQGLYFETPKLEDPVDPTPPDDGGKPKENPTPKEDPTPNKRTFIANDGSRFEFDEEELEYLARMGLDAYMNQGKDKQPQKDDDRGKDKDKTPPDPSDEIKQIRRDLERVQNETRRERSQRALKEQMDSAEKKYDYLQGDSKILNRVRNLVLNDLEDKPALSVEKAYEAAVKDLGLDEEDRIRRLRQKLEDAEATRGAGRGGSVGLPKKAFTAEDMQKGVLRERAKERFEHARAAASGRVQL